jgi:hypothetical protein
MTRVIKKLDRADGVDLRSVVVHLLQVRIDLRENHVDKALSLLDDVIDMMIPAVKVLAEVNRDRE